MRSALSPGWDGTGSDHPDGLSERTLLQTDRVHHVLDGLAGFFATQAAAQAVAHELQATLGIGPDQLVMLAPADAGRLRFNRRARQWNRKLAPVGQPQEAGMVTAAVAGALAGALLSAVVLAWAGLLPLEVEAAVVAMAAVTGALIGAGMAAIVVGQQPQFRKFDLVVRRRLAAGEWVLVAHDIRWTRQADVVSLLSRDSLNWYGVTSEQSHY